jgi:hypothetical protein
MRRGRFRQALIVASGTVLAGVASVPPVTARTASPQTLYKALLATPLTKSQLPAGFHSAKVKAKANGPTPSRHHAVGEVEVILDSGQARVVYVIFPTRANALGNHADGVKALKTMKGLKVQLSAPGVPTPSLIINSSENGLEVTQVSFVAGNVEINAQTFSSSATGGDVESTLRLALFALRHINALK